MAAFATFAAAETYCRAYMRVGGGPFVDMHAGRTVTGVICARVKRRPLLFSNFNNNPKMGGWEEIVDDGA